MSQTLSFDPVRYGGISFNQYEMAHERARVHRDREHNRLLALGHRVTTSEVTVYAFDRRTVYMLHV